MEEERNLEEVVFGAGDDFLEEDEQIEISLKKTKHKTSKVKKRKPAWVDDDADDSKKIVKTGILTPKWAQMERKDCEIEDDEILKLSRNYLKKSETLPKTVIEISKCTNLNYEVKEKAVIKCTKFHPSSQVALVAGYKGIATLFQVDGKTNAKIQSIYFENFPIHNACFTVDGSQFVVGSKEYGFFFYYDMFSGKIVKVPQEKGMDQYNMRRFDVSPDGRFIIVYGRFGNIHLLSAKSKEWISTMKMNGEVYSIAFDKEGSKMYSHGGDGQVYIWDMNARECVHKFYDEGCISGTALAISPNNRYLASGSDSGVVNIYHVDQLISNSNPKCIKSLMNLTTEITNLKFNCTSELLAMSSLYKDNAVRLVHFPSMTVFSNFPNHNKNLKHPHSLDISLNSGFLTIGSSSGVAHLFRLKHYNNY
ncbi:U3 small nucleolar RNA-associated protein 18 homolog [Centruroides sculpturatus]|uniref:U3 small nucleolar RNA-associated protein 18 homolog n=1 Tax=Centruroides sculpturatus TaxID=218467 RepID=UPI000C6DE1FB|nr:U3 small nucleolar RNA-associated protein 18 homolog [Centruroides sculpturatus]